MRETAAELYPYRLCDAWMALTGHFSQGQSLQYEIAEDMLLVGISFGGTSL